MGGGAVSTADSSPALPTVGLWGDPGQLHPLQITVLSGLQLKRLVETQLPASWGSESIKYH